MNRTFQSLIKRVLTAMVITLSLTATTYASDPYNDFLYRLNNSTTNPTTSQTTYAETGIETGLNVVRDELPRGVQGLEQNESAVTLAFEYINWLLLTFLGPIMLVLVIYFGVRLIISRGDEEERKKAMQGIINITLGFLIIYLSFMIVSFIINAFVDQSAQNSAQTTFDNRAPATGDFSI